MTIPAMFLQTGLREWTPKGALSPLATFLKQLSMLVTEFPVCPFYWKHCWHCAGLLRDPVLPTQANSIPALPARFLAPEQCATTSCTESRLLLMTSQHQEACVQLMAIACSAALAACMAAWLLSKPRSVYLLSFYCHRPPTR